MHRVVFPWRTLGSASNSGAVTHTGWGGSRATAVHSDSTAVAHRQQCENALCVLTPSTRACPARDEQQTTRPLGADGNPYLESHGMTPMACAQERAQNTAAGTALTCVRCWAPTQPPGCEEGCCADAGQASSTVSKGPDLWFCLLLVLVRADCVFYEHKPFIKKLFFKMKCFIC